MVFIAKNSSHFEMRLENVALEVIELEAMGVVFKQNCPLEKL